MPGSANGTFCENQPKLATVPVGTDCTESPVNDTPWSLLAWNSTFDHFHSRGSAEAWITKQLAPADNETRGFVLAAPKSRVLSSVQAPEAGWTTTVAVALAAAECPSRTTTLTVWAPAVPNVKTIWFGAPGRGVDATPSTVQS